MIFYISNFIQTFLLPPGCQLFFIILGLLVWYYKPILGKILVTLSIFSLWLLSTPMMAQALINPLQYHYLPLSTNQLSIDKQSAIVILEAGLNLATPEYGSPTVSEATLSRIRYAAFLHQKTNAPILVSGNDPSHPEINQTDYMAQALNEYFKLPVKWKEDRGYNTALEGMMTASILKKDGIKKAYLVTHAFHMPRSMQAFENKGIEIIPAPTGYVGFNHTLGKISGILPSMEALKVSTIALREYIGMLWYKAYYR